MELELDSLTGGFSLVEIMRFDYFDQGVEWEGYLSCTRYAEGFWGDEMALRWDWGNPMEEEGLLAFDAFQLIPGAYYWIKFYWGYDEYDVFRWYAVDVKPATDEDIFFWTRE
jgi:hypothetical protein